MPMTESSQKEENVIERSFLGLDGLPGLSPPWRFLNNRFADLLIDT